MRIVQQKPFSLKQALLQMGVLLTVSGLLALGLNQARQERLPIFGDWSDEARFADAAGKSLVISLELAEQWFRQGTAVFLDARPQSQYNEGHIQGALSLPAQEMERYFLELAEQLDNASGIVAYCDGESCELSHDLALFLQEMGFENVRVLVNGWSAWQQAGLPIETGE